MGKHTGLEQQLRIRDGRLDMDAARIGIQGRVDCGNRPFKFAGESRRGKIRFLPRHDAADGLLGKFKIQVKGIHLSDADNRIAVLQIGTKTHLPHTERACERGSDGRVLEIDLRLPHLGLSLLDGRFVALQLLLRNSPGFNHLSVALINVARIGQRRLSRRQRGFLNGIIQPGENRPALQDLPLRDIERHDSAGNLRGDDGFLGAGQTADGGQLLLQFGDFHRGGFHMDGHRTGTPGFFPAPATRYEEQAKIRPTYSTDLCKPSRPLSPVSDTGKVRQYRFTCRHLLIALIIRDMSCLPWNSHFSVMGT